MPGKEKELRKMSRVELIEIIYALEQNEKNLVQEKEKLEEQLRERTIRMENAGSIAEAAVSLNQIFETAQETADQYVASVTSRYAEMDAQTQKMIEDAENQAKSRLAAAQAQADEIIQQAVRRRMMEEASAEKSIKEKWAVFDQKVKEIIEAHSELGALLGSR